MKRHASAVSALLCALPLALIVPLAHAQAADDMQRVEISGRSAPLVTRFDVHAVCPDMGKSLQDSLALIAYNENRTGTVRVNFRLTGNKMEEVRAEQGPWVYRTATRRAVRNLECADAKSTQPQQFSFLITFNRPSDELAQGERPSLVAVLER